MPKIEIARVYEVKLPVALMPRADVGQIGFSADGQSVMPSAGEHS
jgi:hypothetical protein